MSGDFTLNSSAIIDGITELLTGKYGGKAYKIVTFLITKLKTAYVLPKELLIGRGGYGKAYLQKLSDETLEVKKVLHVKSNTETLREIVKEAFTLTMLSHKNIIELIHCEVKKEGKITKIELYMPYCELILEYLIYPCQVPSALKYVKDFIGFTDRKAYTWVMIEDMLQALKYLTAINIIHRDIKPSNIFIRIEKNGEVITKLGDFGIARNAINTEETDEALTVGKGTALYSAPELRGDEYSFAVDIFSLGIVFYEYLYNLCKTEKPKNRNYIPELVRDANFSPDSNVQKAYPELSEMILQMVKEEPDERPTLESLLNTFEHILDKQSIQKPVHIKKNEKFSNTLQARTNSLFPPINEKQKQKSTKKKKRSSTNEQEELDNSRSKKFGETTYAMMEILNYRYALNERNSGIFENKNEEEIRSALLNEIAKQHENLDKFYQETFKKLMYLFLYGNYETYIENDIKLLNIIISFLYCMYADGEVTGYRLLYRGLCPHHLAERKKKNCCLEPSEIPVTNYYDGSDDRNNDMDREILAKMDALHVLVEKTISEYDQNEIKYEQASYLKNNVPNFKSKPSDSGSNGCSSKTPAIQSQLAEDDKNDEPIDYSEIKFDITLPEQVHSCQKTNQPLQMHDHSDSEVTDDDVTKALD